MVTMLQQSCCMCTMEYVTTDSYSDNANPLYTCNTALYTAILIIQNYFARCCTVMPKRKQV